MRDVHGGVHKARGRRRSERGQAFVELAISMLIFFLVALGIVEFGRILMVANMITHAARDGARAAAVVPPSGRNSAGAIQDTSGIESQVLALIEQVTGSEVAALMNVSVSQTVISGIPMVQVQVTGPVPYLFDLSGFPGLDWDTEVNINRIVTFRDEGAPDPGT